MAQPNIRIEQISTDLLNVTSTGIIWGGAVTINGVDNTKFDIAAGSGNIVDNHTDPMHPTLLNVTWTAFTSVTLTNLATADRTFVAIDSTGSIIQKPTDQFTEAERRAYIVLGALGHANRTNILAARSNPYATFDGSIRMADLAESIGAFTVEGNQYTANGVNLLLNKSAGMTYRIGNNFQVSKASPDVSTDPAETGLTFNYSYRNGTGGFVVTAPTTSINPSLWDNGTGTLAAVPANHWTIQTIHFLSGTTNGTRIEYGQAVYQTLNEARAAVPGDGHVHNPAFSESTIPTYLVVRSGTTDLTNVSNAFISAPSFGNPHGGLKLLQTVFGNVAATSGTSVIPFDNTTPLITEGTQVGFATITPQEDVLSLKIDFSLTIDASANNTTVLIAVFRDTTCITTGVVQINTAGRPRTISLSVVDSPATAGPVTYYGRVGVDVAGPTWYVNSTSTGNNLGGTLVTSFSIAEII